MARRREATPGMHGLWSGRRVRPRRFTTSRPFHRSAAAAPCGILSTLTIPTGNTNERNSHEYAASSNFRRQYYLGTSFTRPRRHVLLDFSRVRDFYDFYRGLSFLPRQDPDWAYAQRRAACPG